MNKQMIQSLVRGRFFTVEFIKKNGERRKMNCRLGVAKYLKGGSLAYDPADHNLMTVFDVAKKQYRMVNLSTLLSFKSGAVEWRATV